MHTHYVKCGLFQTGIHHALPKDAYFDDNLFFEVPSEEKVNNNELLLRFRHFHCELRGLEVYKIIVDVVVVQEILCKTFVNDDSKSGLQVLDGTIVI